MSGTAGPRLAGMVRQDPLALLEEATLAWIESGDVTRDEEMTAMLTGSIEGMLRAFSAGA